ncbi:MAG TPA: hypothetical protein VL463_34855 [Kofleriaceae bacterium]|nr:hypothetical protein [Kofleriaceae bacterium]
MPFANLADVQRKLAKRGFKIDDPLLAKCEKCEAQSVASYIIAGKIGGRTIKLCFECGDARSWRNKPGMEEREEEQDFDLDEWLK